ncbi:hypothetical protein [Acinetobacter larvae]|uniref:EsvE2 n=1 Tax=Acinetobacter larvae TaxID=1789224 RepID=A0A1B2LX83_9GAMM|nr:hypothetical protein [Acinetobacter larvae]AOA57547.1 hypothetical protein BFG52_03715 [Acinetobacter larvae]
MPFFGFIPSQELLDNIQAGLENKNSNEPLYPLRDKTALLINDEIIDAILTDMIRHFPASDRRDTAEKLAGYIKSTVAVLLKQLLGKATNTVVQQSITFSGQSLFQDPDGHQRVGAPMDQDLVRQLKALYAEIASNGDVDRHLLSEAYQKFADATIQHFMTDFNKTLDLGLIKRKASDIGVVAVSKAVHIAIHRLIPHLNQDELKAVAEYHNGLFFD